MTNPTMNHLVHVCMLVVMDVWNDLWDALETFADRHDLPWIMGGDFNMVQAVSKISSGHPRLRGLSMLLI